jgi:hypothetical protein
MTAIHPPDPHGHYHPRPASSILDIWEAADQCVPFNFLLFWVARPPPKVTTATLADLTYVDFVYSVTADFVAVLGCRHNAFTTIILERAPRRSGEFNFMPIMARRDLRLTPEQAEERIEIYLLRQTLRFWEEFFLETGQGHGKVVKLERELLCTRYRQLPWHSVRLEWPRRAGTMEPIYKFRRYHCRCEFWVGAQSGEVEHHHVRDPITPPPVINPSNPTPTHP